MNIKKLILSASLLFMLSISTAFADPYNRPWTTADDCSNVTALGKGCYNTVDKNLYIGDGSTANSIGGSSTPTFDPQAANRIYGGPASGSDDSPTFRALVDNDIPDTITASNYLALSNATGAGVFTASAASTPSFVTATGTNKVFAINNAGVMGFYENLSLILNSAPATDATYSGTLMSVTCGQSGGCAAGKIVYGKLNTTAHNVYYYDSDATDKTEPPLGVVVVAGTEGGACTILTNGTYRLDSYAFTASTDEGKKLYASTTAGNITVTEPANNGVIVGYVIEPPGIVYFSFANQQASTGSGAPVKAVSPTVAAITVTDTTDPTKQIKVDPVNVTTGKLLTFQPTVADNTTFAPTISSSVIDFGALTVKGKIPIVVENTSTTYNVTQAEARANTFYLNTAAGTKTFNLPAAEAGMAVCIKNGQGVTAVLRVDTDGTDYIVMPSGARTTAAGDYFNLASAAGNQVCLVAFDTTDWYVTSYTGTATEE